MNGPGFWSKVLAEFEAANPAASAIVSGGCVRDWMLGLTPKDIDIFYNLPRDAVVNYPTDWQMDPVVQANWTDYGVEDSPIVRITDMIVMDTKVQLVHTSGSCYEHIEHFDSNITKGLYDQLGGLNLPREMLADLENKTVTVRKDSDRSRQRAQRFIEKVGAVEEGWRMVEDYPVQPAARHWVIRPEIRGQQGNLVVDFNILDEL